MQVIAINATESATSAKVIGTTDRCQQDRLILLETSEVLDVKVRYIDSHPYFDP